MARILSDDLMVYYTMVFIQIRSVSQYLTDSYILEKATAAAAAAFEVRENCVFKNRSTVK